MLKDALKKHAAHAFNLLSIYKFVTAAIVLLFFLGILSGFVLPSKIKFDVLKPVGQKFQGINSENPFLFFLTLFLNNSYTGILQIVSGIALIFPAFIIFFNGLVIGLSTDFFLRTTSVNASNIFVFLVAILPHGVLEIPALMVSSVFGTIVGLKIFFSKKISPEKSRTDFFFDVLKTYVIVVLPVFFFAALIESFVSQPLSIAVTGMLAGEKISDAKLNEIILNENDAGQTGITFTEVSPQDFANLGPFVKKMNYLAVLSRLFYDEEIFKEYKDLETFPSLTKIYSGKNPGFYLHIQILRLDSMENAKKAFSLSQKLFYITTEQGEFEVIEHENGAKEAKQGDETAFFKSGFEGTYFYSIQFFGKDFEQFNSLTQKQLSKLR